MKISNLFFILIGCMPVLFFSLEAHGRKALRCDEFHKTKDGQHGSPGYLEDGSNGENGENGQHEQNGGNGGNGGDAD